VTVLAAAATWDGLLSCRGSRRWRSAIDRVEIAGAVPKIWSHLPRAQWSLTLRRIRISDPIPSSVLQFRLFEITSTPATKFVRIPAGCLHFLWVIYIVMASRNFTIVINGIVSVIVRYSLFRSDGPWKKIQTVHPSRKWRIFFLLHFFSAILEVV
jgi:hypothetical protein